MLLLLLLLLLLLPVLVVVLPLVLVVVLPLVPFPLLLRPAAPPVAPVPCVWAAPGCLHVACRV